jgi:X-Pro dipeptidyl-peptidase
MSLQNMKKSILLIISILLLNVSFAQENQKAKPVFENGEAQIVPAFNDPDMWIRLDLWVETEFDTDGDGKLDRMHVDVTRPAQTETEGLKLPVVYNSSPYFAGTSSTNPDYFWDVKHEVGATPPDLVHPPEIVRKGVRPIISKGHVKT